MWFSNGVSAELTASSEPTRRVALLFCGAPVAAVRGVLCRLERVVRALPRLFRELAG
jgi:hypothetical protein